MHHNEQQGEYHTEHDWQMYGRGSEQYEKDYGAQRGTYYTPPSSTVGLLLSAANVHHTAARRGDRRASCQREVADTAGRWFGWRRQWHSAFARVLQ
jgi:hypothetical protein